MFSHVNRYFSVKDLLVATCIIVVGLLREESTFFGISGEVNLRHNPSPNLFRTFLSQAGHSRITFLFLGRRLIFLVSGKGTHIAHLFFSPSPGEHTTKFRSCSESLDVLRFDRFTITTSHRILFQEGTSHHMTHRFSETGKEHHCTTTLRRSTNIRGSTRGILPERWNSTHCRYVRGSAVVLEQVRMSALRFCHVARGDSRGDSRGDTARTQQFSSNRLNAALSSCDHQTAKKLSLPERTNSASASRHLCCAAS